VSWQKLQQKRAAIKPDTLVIGVDIGKYEHVVRALFPGGRFSSPLAISTDRSGFERLLDQVRHWQQESDCHEVTVGMESTGVYWMSLVYWLEERGIRVVQVSTLHVHQSKEMLDNSPAKTDGKDALLIADLVAQGKYLSFVLPRGVHAELRQLVALRDRLAGERTSRLVQLQVVASSLFPEFGGVYHDFAAKTARRVLRCFPTPAEVLKVTPERMARRVRSGGRVYIKAGQLAALRRLAVDSVGVVEGSGAATLALLDSLTELDRVEARLAKVEELLAELTAQVDEARYLMSFHGIGVVTAATILGETGGLGRYDSAAAVLKLAGLDLYEISSGIHKGQRRISKRGRSRLRRALYFAALHHTVPGTPLYDDYRRMVDRGVPKMKAVVALSCRLTRLLYALARDQRCYSAQPPQSLRVA